MSVLFANTRASHGSSSGNLLEFKAGRTLLELGTTPDKRKAVADRSRGLVFVKQSADQLMHFCWKNRDKNTVDMDLIIFPGDTEFVRINECVDGRVYMLKFRSCEDHKIFWFQDPNTDKDDELCKKVNDLLNNPPNNRVGARGGTSERGAANPLAALGSEDMGALSNMDQSQIMQLFSLMNGGNTDILPQLPLANRSASPTATPKRSSEEREAKSESRFDADTLNTILSHIPAGSQRQTPVNLTRVLNRQNLDSVVKANSERLLPLLPSTSEKPVEELEHTLNTPQFQQSVHWFGSALQSGQLGSALKQFDLPDEVVKSADTGDVIQFGKEMTKSFNETTSKVDEAINAAAKDEENAESGAHKDEDMDLD